MTTRDLERAEKLCRLLGPASAEAWSFMWPSGCCVVASVTAAPFLRCALDVDLRVVAGHVARSDRGRWHTLAKHAWIESPEGDIFDKTFGQFDGGEPLRVLPAHDAGVLGHVAEAVLTLDEEEEVRRAIHPRFIAGLNEGPSGWIGSGRTLVTNLFSDYPRLATEMDRYQLKLYVEQILEARERTFRELVEELGLTPAEEAA